MNKFYTSLDKMYSESDRIKIQKNKNPSKQSHKVNINTLLNRVKIEEKKKIKRNFSLLICGVVLIILSFVFLTV
tara:strand:+ start:364 stop:585 length:222 start_codon:yes stop_codon:yes gene_type:complete